MSKFVCSQKTYDKMCAVFDSMGYTADEYVPSKQDLTERIIPNLDKQSYITFLLWIDATGIETEKNATVRKQIRDIITEHFEINSGKEDAE